MSSNVSKHIAQSPVVMLDAAIEGSKSTIARMRGSADISRLVMMLRMCWSMVGDASAGAFGYLVPS